MRPGLPSGTVTFLFTDVEGSTKLLHALGAEAYADALAEHHRTLRDAFTRHGGVEVDTHPDGATRSAMRGREQPRVWPRLNPYLNPYDSCPMCPMRPMESFLNQVGTHGTIRPTSGMRYHLSTTKCCGCLAHKPQHLVVLAESHVDEPLSGTTPAPVLGSHVNRRGVIASTRFSIGATSG